MERIKQALERASAERHDFKSDQVTNGLRQKSTSNPVVAAKSIDLEGIRKLNLTPELRRSKRLIGNSDESASAHQYRLLRSHIRHQISTEKSCKIGVTSANSGEGKTLTAINLAITMTTEVGSEVLLIDADLRQPSIQQYFGAPRGIGLVDVLNDKASIVEALVDPGIAGLTLLVGGAPCNQASELLDSPNMKSLIQLLRGSFSDIVFDLPPALSTVDAFVFSPLLDGILLVIAEGETRPDQLNKTVDMLNHENLIGAVLNKSRRTRPTQEYRVLT